jgi:hypothetical protein
MSARLVSRYLCGTGVAAVGRGGPAGAQLRRILTGNRFAQSVGDSMPGFDSLEPPGKNEPAPLRDRLDLIVA